MRRFGLRAALHPTPRSTFTHTALLAGGPKIGDPFIPFPVPPVAGFDAASACVKEGPELGLLEMPNRLEEPP